MKEKGMVVEEIEVEVPKGVVTQLDARQSILHTSDRIATCIDNLEQYDEVTLQQAKLSKRKLNTLRHRNDDIDDMTSFDFGKLYEREKELLRKCNDALNLLRLSNTPPQSPLRSSNSLLRSRNSPLPSPRASLEISRNIIFPTLESDFSDLSPDVKREFLSRLRNYLDATLYTTHRISVDENSDAKLCGFTYKTIPPYFTNKFPQTQISYGKSPYVVEWVFDGIKYRAPYRHPQSTEPHKGYLEIELEKRFALFRKNVRAPYYRDQISTTLEKVDRVITTRTLPIELGHLEDDFGFLDLYLMPNSTIEKNASDLYKFITNFEKPLKYNVSQFIHWYLSSKFNSALIFSQYFAVDATLEDILAELIYEYLVHHDVWTDIQGNLSNIELEEKMKDPQVIADDRVEFNKDFEQIAFEIENSYRDLLGRYNYPPELEFKPVKNYELPQSGTIRQILESCLRPLVFLDDLGEYALFFKAQMRTGYYVLSQFYEYKDENLILLFPEFVLHFLKEKQHDVKFLEMVNKKISDLLSFKVDEVYKRLKNNTPIRTSISIQNYSRYGTDNFWTENTKPAIESLADTGVYLGDLYKHFRAHILSTHISQSYSVDLVDTDAILDELGKYIITTRYDTATGKNMINYTAIAQIVAEVAKNGKKPRSFNDKLYNCLQEKIFHTRSSNTYAGKRGRQDLTETSSTLQDD